MIGQKITRKVDKAVFTVVGVSEGSYVLQPVKFGQSITATARDLRKDFTAARAEAPTEGDAQGGWDRLAARFRAKANRRPRAIHAPSPETVIRDGEQAAAKAVAAKIVADENKTAEYEAGLLPVSDAVAAAVDSLLKDARRGD